MHGARSSPWPTSKRTRGAAGNKEVPLSPIAIEVVRRIDTLFEVERSINGRSPKERLQVRQAFSQPLVEDCRSMCANSSPNCPAAMTWPKGYILNRWASFTLFLEDGRVCLSNNAAARGLRGITLGQNPGCSGSDRGGRRAAAMYSLIVTAKMNGIDPWAWLTIIWQQRCSGVVLRPLRPF
jgi:hypothetical protein